MVIPSLSRDSQHRAARCPLIKREGIVAVNKSKTKKQLAAFSFS
jgi:hypothetical protein